MATFFVDFENGNDNWGGTSFAPLASGVNGRITGSTFSASTANFLNNGTLCNTKNLFAYSESLMNDNYWTTARTTRTLSNIARPAAISSSNVWNILETPDTNTHDIRTVSTTVNLTLGQNYTTSCYVRADGRNQIIIRHGNTAAKGIRFNLSNGTIGASGASATGAISDAGNGWYRISLTTTPDSATDLIHIMLAQDSYTLTTAESYAGDITRGFYIAALQLEQANSVTSYEIPVSQQHLSIFNGSSHVSYHIINVINSTSLGLLTIPGGAALANQAVDRQYFIGGRWRTLNTGATAARLKSGDNIRIMASPDPSIIGNATWTSSVMRAVGGISSSTNASPISITSPNHGYSSGDTVFITGHTTNTNANGTWEITVTGANTFTLNGSTGNGIGAATGTVRLRNNDVIRLPSALTANIASFGNRGNGRTAWVASANITTTLDTTDYKEGDVSDSIAIGAAFTTGKAAYQATGTLNLSGHQQVSFWIKQTAGTVSVDGDISLRLCTDTIGDVSVHTINIPGLVSLSRWTPVTVNLNTNLNSAIRSVALYVDADKGAQTFLISNIIACRASSSSDSINLLSLLSKNTTNEPWWPIQSINGTRIMIDDQTNTTQASTALRGYHGISETVTTHKIEPIKRPYTATGTTVLDNINESGADGAPIIIAGGWDRISMSTRSGYTWLDGGNGNGYIISAVNNRNYIDYSYFGFVRCSAGLYLQNNVYGNVSDIYGCASTFPVYLYNNYKNIVNNIIGCCCNTVLFYAIQSAGSTFNNIVLKSNSNQGFYSSYSSNAIINNLISNNNSSSGFIAEHSNTNTINNGTFRDNTFGITFSAGAANNFINNCSTFGSSTALLGAQGVNYLKNCDINESVEFAAGSPFSNGRVVSINHDNVANNHVIFTDNGLIRNSVSIRYSNSGFAWSMSPTNIRRDSTYPLDFSIAKIAVNANSLATVRAWVRRSDTRLTMGLRLKGNQISGVPNDITSYMSGAADTWEQVTLNFTPTEAGVVEILAECFGGSTFTGYVDDISVTQI